MQRSILKEKLFDIVPLFFFFVALLLLSSCGGQRGIRSNASFQEQKYLDLDRKYAHTESEKADERSVGSEKRDKGPSDVLGQKLGEPTSKLYEDPDTAGKISREGQVDKDLLDDEPERKQGEKEPFSSPSDLGKSNRRNDGPEEFREAVPSPMISSIPKKNKVLEEELPEEMEEREKGDGASWFHTMIALYTLSFWIGAILTGIAAFTLSLPTLIVGGSFILLGLLLMIFFGYNEHMGIFWYVIGELIGIVIYFSYYWWFFGF